MAMTVADDVRADVNRWFEIALFEHWSSSPHGIARVTQRLFLEAVESGCRFLYYHPSRREFVEARDVSVFLSLARQQAAYDPRELPSGDAVSDVVVGASRHEVALTGCSWDHDHYIPSLAALSALGRNVKVSVVIYDLIAQRFPHFFTREFGARVAASQRQLFELGHRFVCISRSTARDVRAHCSAGKSVTIFRLGEDVHPARDVATRPVGRPFVLCVGTIEVRKNHALLYWLWQQLASRLGDSCPRLVVVGKVGWLAGDVAELMVRDPLTRDHIEIRNDVTDAELVSLYTRCLFTIYPSFYEGYGLPASESLGMGRVCVTSNTSSLPEINPFPDLMFDPSNPQDALRVLLPLIENPALVADYESRLASLYRPQSWAACFKEFESVAWGLGGDL